MTVVTPLASLRHRLAHLGALAILVGVLWCLPIEARAQMTLLQRNYDTAGNTRLEVTAVFSPEIDRGYLPVRVTIRNSTVLNRSWNLSFNIGRSGWNDMDYRSSFSISVPAGSEAVEDLLVPVPTLINGGSTYRQFQVEATSAGLASETNNHSVNLTADFPSLAISSKLAQRNITSLNSQVSSSVSGADTFGATYEAGQLPADWRGYTGLDALMITQEEWESVSPGAKLAMLEWIRLGGRLDLYTRQPNAAGYLESLKLDADGISENRARRGLGQVVAWTWNGSDLSANPTVQRYRSIGSNRAKDFAEDFRSNWPLHQLFGTKSFNPLLVVLLLIAFGVIVGPVNLFVLAKPGRRHRLFITTPIISLVASLLIMLLILFSDGIGGGGRRLVLAELQPGASEKRLYVTQEQISRTGVMIGTAFEMAEPVFLSPVILPPSEWNRMNASNHPIAAYSLTGNVFRGDWYQSRSEQGHFLQAVQPTRSRVELQAASPDGKQAPKLFSSLEFPVDELFYRDELGMVWKSTNTGAIVGGQPIPLAPADFKDLEKWWREQISPLSDGTRKRASALWKSNGSFFAISHDSHAGFIDTLGSIRWKNDAAVIHGPVVSAPGGAAPAN